MKRILSFVLALLVFTANIFFVTSCKDKSSTKKEEEPSSCVEHIDADLNNVCDVCEEALKDDESEPPTEGVIKVPEYKDYLRGTKNFDELVYSRPDIDAAIAFFDSVSVIISENSISYAEQLLKLDEVESVFNNVKSMNAIATIYNYKDTTNEFWLDEYHFLTTNYPKFTQGVEKLFVSAANSPHVESFEEDFFGDLDEYRDGGIYTDEVVALMQTEAELEAEYSALSTATVTISYGDMTDTYDNILAFYKEKLGEGSSDYLKVKTLCDELYREAASKIESELLVELIRARKLISNALGYESYAEYAYSTLYHDYSPEKMDDFIDSVIDIAIPVYINLSKELFSPYIYEYEKTIASTKVQKSEIFNTLYEVYTSCDPELGEIYSYMLQHKLYDAEKENNHRFNGSFMTYINTNESPFLFATLSGTMLDYATIAHEFGHFADAYINYDEEASLDLLEVSSQALELLTMTKLEGEFNQNAYRYFLYLKFDEIFSTIIFQSFYASFEINAYKLDYEDITLENLNAIVSSVAKEFGFSSICNSVEYVAIPHIFLYPFYVQSYATSAMAALEIYTLEAKNEGDGFKAYSSLLKRDAENPLSFEESLKANGISSPFEKNAFKKVLNEFHYATLGAYYFKVHDGSST